MFLSYCMVFGMSLLASPSWRLMLGILSILSIIYFVLTVFYLPESPRWLVSKGRMLEAQRVLQKLRGTEDVSGLLLILWFARSLYMYSDLCFRMHSIII
jgi:MFS family permease